jgi:hypothetical protein
MPIIVNVHEAKTHLSRLLRPGPRREGDHPCQGWQALRSADAAGRRASKAIPGRLQGRLGDAFFEPLPEAELNAWEER